MSSPDVQLYLCFECMSALVLTDTVPSEAASRHTLLENQLCGALQVATKDHWYMQAEHDLRVPHELSSLQGLTCMWLERLPFLHQHPVPPVQLV